LADTISNDDDRELTERILGGDAEAFGNLVEKYHPRVFRLVRGILGDWHRSEDICQEVFTTIYRKLDGFRHRSRLSTWVFRIAVNAALKARKRQGRFRQESMEALQGFASVEDPRPARLEGDEVFRRLLAPLPEKLRIAVVLREQMGLNYQEMSRVLGCSRGAVEQRIHRAMVTLREIWRNSESRERDHE
jgi:RNA polymerase sigma-70 factor (ECF subfamily)